MLVYHDGKGKVPAHWGVFITDEEDDKKGTVYHAIGSPFQGYQVDVKIQYDLSKTKRRHSKLLLGTMDEVWRDQLAAIAGGIKAPGISPRPLDPFAVSTTWSPIVPPPSSFDNTWLCANKVVKGEHCQNWLENFIQHLIGLGAIDSSAMNEVLSAPRV